MPRAPYAKRFACLDCGTPVGHPDSRCAACRRVTKAAYNRRYLAAYHERTRPRPAPEPQPGRGDLPPLGTLIYEDDGSGVQCHACGRMYAALNHHVRAHRLTPNAYKERYGLARTQSLWSPSYTAKQRALALARNQGEVGRQALAEAAPPPPNPGASWRLSSRIKESVAKVGTYRGRQRD